MIACHLHIQHSIAMGRLLGRRPGLTALLGRLGKGRRRRSIIAGLLCISALSLIRRRGQQAADAATAAAILAGAGVHGFVDKAGPLDPQQWQVGFKEWRQNRTQEWVAQRQAQLAAGECRAAKRGRVPCASHGCGWVAPPLACRSTLPAAQPTFHVCTGPVP